MIELKYGKQKLRFNLDNLPSAPSILAGKDALAARDEAAAVRDALDHPISSPRLRELVSPRDRVVIVAPDLTRPAKSDVVVPAVLDELHSAGTRDAMITVVFALGLHTPNSEAEKQQIVGMDVARRVRLVDHDARDPRQNVMLGKTSFGSEVAINRLVVESEKVVVTGTIGYHLFAGFGGGRKGIFPGVAGAKGILANHMLPLTAVASGWHPAARTGNLEGNPVHLDMVEAANMARPCFLVNSVVNSENQLVKVFAGHLHTAFEEGCEFFDQHYCLRTDGKADFVIVDCGGYPKDINFIQSHKTMHYGMDALREGGVMLVLAACAHGLGNRTFPDWFRYKTEEEFERGLKASYMRGGMNAQTAYLLFRKTRRATILLFTQLPDKVVYQMGMIPVGTMEDALAITHEKLGNDFSTSIIPAGGYFRIEAE